MSTSPTSPPRTSLLFEVTRRLPLLLLLFLATPPTLAHTPLSYYTYPPLQLGNVRHTSLSQIFHSLLRPGRSLIFTLAPPQNSTKTTLLIEAWFEPNHFFDAHPIPLLLASPLRTPPQAPPFKSPAVVADYEAFWTRRNYHYLIVNDFTRPWYVRLLNHDKAAQSFLNATVRISTFSNSTTVCPSGPGPLKCSGKGTCVLNQCKCRHRYGGRYCQTIINPLPVLPVDVPLQKMSYFRYSVPRNGSIAVVMTSVTPTTLVSSQPILFAKLRGENGGHGLEKGSPLPSLYDWKYSDHSLLFSRQPFQRIVRDNMKKGQILYIGVYVMHRTALWFTRGQTHFATIGLLPAHGSARIQLNAFPCVKTPTLTRNGLTQCPLTFSREQRQANLAFAFVPLLLGMLALFTMVVFVSIWASVFRQQFFDAVHTHQAEDLLSRCDKLSETEVNAMFPAFEFTKGETVALGATGDVCCSVCLCSFEEGEYLRRLACGHSYHANCLDQWLLTNATCPRCRKSARINGDMAKVSFLTRFIPRGINIRIQQLFSWISTRASFTQPRAVATPDDEEQDELLEEHQNTERRAVHTV